jgi:hypothetical protein
MDPEKGSLLASELKAKYRRIQNKERIISSLENSLLASQIRPSG